MIGLSEVFDDTLHLTVVFGSFPPQTKHLRGRIGACSMRAGARDCHLWYYSIWDAYTSTPSC